MSQPRSGVQTANDSASQAAKKRVLVIEDDQDQRSALAQRLRFEGYEASFAADAPGAVRMARVQRPDVIILDLGLPGGDGYLVMERLQAIPLLSTIPIVVLSARDATKEKPKAMLSGAVAYFQKPIANAALRAALTHAVNG